MVRLIEASGRPAVATVRAMAGDWLIATRKLARSGGGPAALRASTSTIESLPPPMGTATPCRGASWSWPGAIPAGGGACGPASDGGGCSPRVVSSNLDRHLQVVGDGELPQPLVVKVVHEPGLGACEGPRLDDDPGRGGRLEIADPRRQVDEPQRPLDSRPGVGSERISAEFDRLAKTMGVVEGVVEIGGVAGGVELEADDPERLDTVELGHAHDVLVPAPAAAALVACPAARNRLKRSLRSR